MSTFLNITCMKFVKPEKSFSDSSKLEPELEVDPCMQCSGVSDDYERATITKSAIRTVTVQHTLLLSSLNAKNWTRCILKFEQFECLQEPGHFNMETKDRNSKHLAWVLIVRCCVFHIPEVRIVSIRFIT